jgi:4-amino-4-deoxy-L-arabinose transferase-like glycosyltransferase
LKKTLILWLFILIKFGLHCVIIGTGYDLHRDEYLHLDQAKHLAWGYLSVPPFTSWISYLILLLGNSVFWVKFFPALFGVLTMVVVWKAIEALKGGLFALILGAAALTFSVLLRINMLYQPNSADILFWTLLYFSVLKYIESEDNKWLYLTAVALGFGFLNKYNIIFQVIGLIPALLITPQRKIFVNKHLYFAGMIALLIVLPNLIWQFQNNFPVVHHMKLLEKTQLVNVNRLDFLKEQLLFFMGSIFVLVAAFFSFFQYPAFRKYQAFFWAFVFTLSLFTYLKAKGYYAIGLYPIFFAFGAAYLENALRLKFTWLRPVAVLVILLLFIPIFRVAFPIDSPAVMSQHSKRYQALGLLRWEDGRDHTLPQDFADMLGWKELAEKVDAAYEKIEDKSHTLVLCDNYGQAGAINYYSRYNIQAVTMNADYINWVPLDEEIKNVILVQSADDDDQDRKKEQPLFKTILRTGKIENQYAREQGTSIYALLDAKVSINKILKSDISENKWD